MSRSFQANFKVTEIADTINKISAYDGKTRLKLEKAISNSVKNVARGARQRAPVHSGELKRKIVSRFNASQMSGAVAARTPYAHLPEFGAKAAIARPKTKKTMTVGGSDYGPLMPGQTHFAKEVHVKAREARPYMRPAFEDEKPKLIQSIKEAVQP